MSEAPARRRYRKGVTEPRPEYVAENGDKLKREDGRIWSRVRQRWLVETPEEYVRQEYFLILLHEYGFKVEQIAEEEEVTGRGSGHARADFVVWRTPEDKDARKPPLIIVECKADHITIRPQDYAQGDNYARLTDALFVVTHNNNETKFWRVRKDKMPGYLEEIENIPHADATDKQIEELFARLKVFKENEVERVAKSRATVARLKADAKARADAAKADVEAMILGIKPTQSA